MNNSLMIGSGGFVSPPMYIFWTDFWFTLAILAIPLTIILINIFIYLAYKNKAKRSIYIIIAFLPLMLLIPFGWFQYDINNDGKLYQTCTSAPDSYGCEMCKITEDVFSGIDPKAICEFCEEEYRQLSNGKLDFMEDISVNCKSTQDSGMLQIEKTIWSGWDGGSTSKSNDEITLADNSEIVLEGLHADDTYAISIVQKSDDEITIAFTGLSNIDDGIDFDGCSQNHEIKIESGESITLQTCSLDVGVEWVITYSN